MRNIQTNFGYIVKRRSNYARLFFQFIIHLSSFVVVIQRGLYISVKPNFYHCHKYGLVAFIADIFEFGGWLSHVFIVHILETS